MLKGAGRTVHCNNLAGNAKYMKVWEWMMGAGRGVLAF